MKKAQRLGLVFVAMLAVAPAFAQQSSSSPIAAPSTGSAPPAFDVDLLEPAKKAGTKPEKSIPVSKPVLRPALPVNTPSQPHGPSKSATTTYATAPATAPVTAAPITITVQPDINLVPIAPLPTDLVGGIAGSDVSFEIHSGDTLKSTISRWSLGVGWTLIWQAPTDYAIEAGMTFRAGTSYLEAVRQIMGSFWDRTQSLTATAYKNNVLVVSARGAQ